MMQSIMDLSSPSPSTTNTTGRSHWPDADDGTIGWTTLLLASLAVLAVFLDTTALFVAFPDIVESFPAASPAQLSWVLNAYTITFAALLVPLGKVADRVGHKRSFLTGSIVFTATSLACALAPSSGALVGFRLLQAVGAAMLVPSSLALVLRAVAPSRVPFAVALWGATGALAGAIGPTLGSAVVELSSWRWVFLLNLPVGIATVALGRRHLVERRDPTTALPAPLGSALVAAAAALLSLGLVQSAEWGWADARTVAALVAGALLLAAFVAHQRRTSAPALDLELFAIGNYRWANAATAVYGVAFTAMFFGSILFLTQVWDWSIFEAGLGVSPGPLLVAVLAPQVGRMAVRVGQRRLLLAGGLVFAAGGLWRILALGASPDYLRDYLPSMLLTGVGVALVLPQLSSVSAQALPSNRLAVGSAANQAVRQLAGTFGVAMTVAFVSGSTGVSDALAGFDRVWWLLVVAGVGTTLLSLPLRTPRPRRVDASTPQASAPALVGAPEGLPHHVRAEA
jgi:EmrB/QacA subfamily drug resistance transporter